MAKNNKPVTEEVDPKSRGTRTLIYGDTGAGKTSLAASAALHPSYYPLISLNLDDGFTSIAHLNGVNKELGIPSIYSTRIENPDQAVWVMQEMLKPSEEREKPYDDAKTLLIDSISAWRDKTLNYVVDINAAKDKAKGKPRDTFSMPQWADYGAMTNVLLSILYGYCQNGLNLILTAGIDETVDENGISLKAEPLLNPKLRQSVYHMMDFIWFVREKNTRYQLLTLPRGTQKIKTRNPLFVRALEADSVEQYLKGKDYSEEAKKKSANVVGWYDLGIDEAGYVTPGIGYFYDMYINSVTKDEENG